LVRGHGGGQRVGRGITAVTDEEILEAYRFLAQRGVGVL
jgi:threonine synthase